MSPTERQDKIMHCFKCNFAKYIARDCTGLRNNINTVMVHFTLFNVDTHY